MGDGAPPRRILVPLLYHKQVGCQSNFCAVRFLYRAANSAILKFIREWKENAGNFRPAEDESMDKIIIRPMTPEDWGAVSRIYVEGIATEYATFQTECPPYTAWDASHTKECRLVILSGGVLAGWCALHRVDPRWCYRGVAEVSIYVGEQFRGHGLGFQLLSALCSAAEKAGYWTLQSTVLQDNAASRALHAKCGFRLVGRRERIARDCRGHWLDTYLMERRAAADEPEGFKKL